MGAWSVEPWGNDDAADWFGALWESANVPASIKSALESGDGNRSYAALWMCSQLCRVYVWPIDDLASTLDAGVAAADRLLAGEDWDSLVNEWTRPESKESFINQVTECRQILVDRRGN